MNFVLDFRQKKNHLLKEIFKDIIQSHSFPLFNSSIASYNSQHFSSIDRGTTVQTFNIQYGKQFAVNARSKNPYDAVYNDWTCWIKDSEGTKYAEHKSIAGVVTMPANDVTVEFEFKSAGSWATFNAQVCWDVTVYNTKNITGIDNFTW